MQSPTKTNDPSIPPDHVIHMQLGGYMGRYIWFINGKPEYQAKPIMIKRGERYRIIFTNKTIMHHPMHIHGHWFILRNGYGAYDPKLHTIAILPGQTVVVDFDADQSGQWYFHCHNLYHMLAGMATILRYQGTPEKEVAGLDGEKSRWYFANRVDVSYDPINDSYLGNLNILMGPDFNKLQIFTRDAEVTKGSVESADVDVFYWHVISQFWALKGGLNYVYRPASTPYVQPGIGIQGLAPFFIQTNIRAYLHQGSAKLDTIFTRDTQLTHRIFLRLELESLFASKTLEQDQIGTGLNFMQWTVQPYYQLNYNTSLYFSYQHTSYYGELRDNLDASGDATSVDNYYFGVSLLL